MRKSIQCNLLGLALVSLLVSPLSIRAEEAPAPLKAKERQPACFQSWPKGLSPVEIGRRVTKSFLKAGHPNFDSPKPAPFITYPEVCAWYGGLTFAKLSGDKELTEGLIRRFELLFGPEARLIPKSVNVDLAVFGVVPLEIYLQTGDKRCLELGLLSADQQWNAPEKEKEKFSAEIKDLMGQGLTWHTRFWIDDMYMITMLQSQAYRVTGNKQYIDRAAKELLVYLDKLQESNGLFFHAPDVPFFWGRGNGWMAVGMSELLRALPEDHPDRPAILQGYKKMMKTLLQTQGDEGLWRQLVDDPESWIETSCTAMFTFALITGVKNGWLEEEAYGAAARKGWLGLVKYLNDDALLREICIGTGKKNSRDHYLQRPREIGDMHGQAPVLWCASALLR